MTPTIKKILLALVAILIVISVWYLESRKANVAPSNTSVQEVNLNLSSQNAEERISAKKEKYEVAKEITTPDGFINTDGITVNELIGKKVILVDFWTYSCINCQRTLPYLNTWYERYEKDGLEILAIHTPEFDFEKEYENVKRAVEKYGIKYPVILDNDFSTWQAYKNRYWPRKYLIDIDGFIVYDHIGEGAYDETEEKIVELLNERAKVLGENAVEMKDGKIDAESVDSSMVKTPETYFGYSRLEYLQNLPSKDCYDKDCAFSLDEKSLAKDAFALEGVWKILKESMQVGEVGSSIYLNFEANKVNFVAGGFDNKPVRVQIFLDGQEVKDGLVTITNADLYNLIDLQGKPGRHTLQIKALDKGLEAFTFTFG